MIRPQGCNSRCRLHLALVYEGIPSDWRIVPSQALPTGRASITSRFSSTFLPTSATDAASNAHFDRSRSWRRIARSSRRRSRPVLSGERLERARPSRRDEERLELGTRRGGEKGQWRCPRQRHSGFAELDALRRCQSTLPSPNDSLLEPLRIVLSYDFY